MEKENMPDLIIGITQQLNAVEFDSMENAVKSTPFAIFKLSYTFTYKTNRGNPHDIYDYFVYNSQGKQEYPKVNNWSISSISQGGFRYREDIKSSSNKISQWGAGVTVKYSDPLGYVNSRIIFGPQEMIAYLYEISSSNTWKEYLLEKENLALSEKIKSLEGQIETLKKENISLKTNN